MWLKFPLKRGIRSLLPLILAGPTAFQALACQVNPERSKYALLGFLQRSGEVTAGGKGVTAATQLERHPCDVEAGHGA